jgi:glucokinase
VAVFFGVDIGGTNVKTAFIAGDGTVLSKSEFPTLADQGVEDLVQRLHAHAEEGAIALGAALSDLAGVGVGVPGFLDDSRTTVVEAVNLGWRQVPLVPLLERQLGVPVAMENDANVAALGEAWRGAGAGKTNLLCVTVGTGIGGGIVLGGRLHRGKNGMAGEIGHLVVQRRGGIQCNCGQTGCLETVASATGIIRAAKERLPEPVRGEIRGASDVFRLAEQGVTIAREVIQEAADWLGYGLALAAVTINPDGIVIGGGVSKAQELFLNPVRAAFAKYSLPRVREAAELTAAALGNDAGVVGAVRLVQQHIQQAK